MNLNYIVTETGGPDSFDPRNADKTQNLNVMRMLYATPLETDQNNLLKSSVLKSFSYDEEKSVATFEVRDDVRYSDGNVLTIADIALAIARTGYFHPEFPVIKNIIGLRSWAESKRGLRTLPEGLVISGNSLKIHFDRKVANPLFRFCLELFSIVPSVCLDLDTAEMKCDIAPSSGYFTIQKKLEKSIVFEKRKDIANAVDEISFDTITFIFQSMLEACQRTLSESDVISGSEIDFISSGCAKMVDEKQIYWMPSARLLVLRFNPGNSLFSKKENRQYFAQVVRDSLSAKNRKLIIEKSLFPKLLPGYLSSSEFTPPPDVQQNFKGVKIAIPKFGSTVGLLFEALLDAGKKLEMNVQSVYQEKMSEIVDSFVAGKFSVIAGGSGFWAQDPVGDVSMWFTKNLHKTMTFTWEDKEIYKQIDGLEAELDANKIRERMENFNRYIHDQSIIAPILHFRRLYISNVNSERLNIPQAITSPAPWQLKTK